MNSGPDQRRNYLNHFFPRMFKILTLSTGKLMLDDALQKGTWTLLKSRTTAENAKKCVHVTQVSSSAHFPGLLHPC